MSEDLLCVPHGAVDGDRPGRAWGRSRPGGRATPTLGPCGRLGRAPPHEAAARSAAAPARLRGLLCARGSGRHLPPLSRPAAPRLGPPGLAPAR